MLPVSRLMLLEERGTPAQHSVRPDRVGEEGRIRKKGKDRRAGRAPKFAKSPRLSAPRDGRRRCEGTLRESSGKGGKKRDLPAETDCQLREGVVRGSGAKKRGPLR